MSETNGRHASGREIAIETMVVILAAAFLTGAVYLWDYAHGVNLAGDSLIDSAEQRLAGSKPTPAQLAASLQAAQAKLAKQSALLSAMKADFPSSPELNKQITDAYAAAAAAVAKTDKLFNDPDSADPTLKDADADPARTAAIAALRSEINADLAGWKSASAGAASTLVLSQEALADLAAMQRYMNQLQSFFADLPPSNALQSDIIIAYQSQISEEALAINDSINEVDSVGAPPIVAVNDSNTPGNGQAGNGSDQNPSDNGGSNGGSSGGLSSGSGQSNGDNSSGSSSDGGQSGGSTGNAPALPPVVTVGDVNAAQNNIDQTGNEIQSIEQQISDSGNPDSNSGSGGSGSSGSGGSGSGGSSDTGNLDYWGSQGSNGGQGLDNGSGGNLGPSDYMQYIPPEDQPGNGPHLIQGDNPFQ